MSGRDLRTTPARPDLAAASLKGEVEAPRYVEPQEMRLAALACDVRNAPDIGAERATELLLGEVFDAYEIKDGWAWGQVRSDGYVGYVRADALAPSASAPTHRIAAPRSLAFSAPSIKTPAPVTVSFGAQIAVEREEKRLAYCTGLGWVPCVHLRPLDELITDIVETARLFLGAPYGWGGRSADGIDCSGLVQVALQAAGLACPRDSDQQEAALGEQLPKSAPLLRNDLVFWGGHVGVMTDAETVLHANAFHMAVVKEELAEAAARIDKTAGPITSIRRLKL